MNDGELGVEARVDETFESEVMAYSRLSRYATRQETESFDAEQALAQSVAGDAAEVLWTARVMIELYGTWHRVQARSVPADPC